MAVTFFNFIKRLSFVGFSLLLWRLTIITTDMPNIYLKVPTYVAQFYRGRNPKSTLTEFDPVDFLPTSYEYMLMQSTLVITEGMTAHWPACFSQREWKNMLQGRPAQGGKKILFRDENEWLSTREVCALIGDTTNNKTDGFDYLCIACPKQAIIGQQVAKVNSTYSLTRIVANQLTTILRSEFIRVLLDWIRQERFYCNQRGIQRSTVLMIDHFFYHYGILVGTNGKDIDSMRRMAVRWLEEALTLPNDRVDWEDEEAQYIYNKEQAEQDIPLSTMLKELKEQVKE